MWLSVRRSHSQYSKHCKYILLMPFHSPFMCAVFRFVRLGPYPWIAIYSKSYWSVCMSMNEQTAKDQQQMNVIKCSWDEMEEKKKQMRIGWFIIRVGWKTLESKHTHRIIIRGKIYANLLHYSRCQRHQRSHFWLFRIVFIREHSNASHWFQHTHNIFIHTWTTWFNRLLLENRCRNSTYNKMANVKLFKKFYLKILLQFVCSTLFIQGKFLIYFQTHS